MGEGPGQPPKSESQSFDQRVDRAIEIYRTAPGGRLERALAAFRELTANLSVGGIIKILLGSSSGSGAKPTAPAPADEALLAAVDQQLSEIEHEAVPQSDGERTAEPEAPEIPAPESSALAAYLDKAEEDTKSRDGELKSEISDIRSLEKLVRRVILAAGTAALILAIIGIGLAFAGVTAVAVVSAAVAVLPAAGTAILFKFETTLHRKREGPEAQRERNNRALETVRAVAAIENPAERQRQFAAYVQDLRERG